MNIKTAGTIQEALQAAPLTLRPHCPITGDRKKAGKPSATAAAWA
jgi:hypothetical protein